MTHEQLPRPGQGEQLRILRDGQVVGWATVHGYNSGPPYGPWVVAVYEGHTDVRLRELLQDEHGWYVNADP